MKPCLQLVGSKVLLAKQIVDLLGRHTSYCEPYVGSAAVLLSKEPVYVETINDKDELLIAFYRTLRNESTRYRLIDALTYTPYARAELRDAVDDPDLDDVERARRFMVRTNQRYVGGQGGWTYTVRGSSGHSNASKWNNFRTRLSLVAERMQNVQINNADALEVLARVKFAHDTSIATYIDPPYPPTTRNGSKYTEDATLVHHTDLLAMVADMEGPTVISSYPSPLYDDTLPEYGWIKREIATRASGQSGKGGTAQRTEVLWSNPACVRIETPVLTAVESDPEPVVQDA